MRVLRERETWAKPKTPRAGDISPEEQAHVRTALAFLRRRFGSWPKLAKALGMKPATVWKATRRSKPSAGLALRVARVAGAAVEDVLSGAWPRAGACPMCGH